MTILVTGATGTIGRLVADQLARAGQEVRALTRDPAGAALPDGVHAVAGDLTAPRTLEAALDGATGMHLISLGGDDYAPLETAPEIMDRAVKAGVRRVTVLTGSDAELAVLDAVRASGVEWTHVRPLEFMANKLVWSASIRDEGIVRSAFPGSRAALVHEADVAAVITAALLEDGHAGATYTPTGPEVLTRFDAAEIIGTVIGQEIRFVELTRQQAYEEARAAGISHDVATYVLDYEADPPAEASTVLPVVEKVTGRPARPFTQWAAEHADAFGAAS